MGGKKTRPATPGSLRRKVRNSIVAILSLLVLGALAWYYPLWILERILYAHLRFEGVRSEYDLVDGYKIHYLVGGTGSPVVLVHGLGAQATAWSALIPFLIHAGHRVYAPDLLGYGLSQQPSNATYSISEEASIVQSFLQTLQLNRIDLAGWSMGGWVAMRVALNDPARIRRLILLDSAGLRFQPTFDPSVFEPDTPQQMAVLRRLLEPPHQPAPQFLIKAILRRGQHYHWVTHRSMHSMLTGKDVLDGELAPLTMPVLIGWGKEDRLIPLPIGYRLHAQIPDSVLAIYAGCGHLAPELCVNEVGPNVVDFLNAKSAPKAGVEQITAAH